jgi:hypothetical protein
MVMFSLYMPWWRKTKGRYSSTQMLFMEIQEEESQGQALVAVTIMQEAGWAPRTALISFKGKTRCSFGP